MLESIVGIRKSHWVYNLPKAGGLANFIKVLVKGTNCYVNITRLSF